MAQTFLSATSPATLYMRDYTFAGQVQRESTIFGTAHFTLTEKYDTLGRTEGYALSNTVSGISTMISDTTHAYDPVGRLDRVAVGFQGQNLDFGLAWLSHFTLCIALRRRRSSRSASASSDFARQQLSRF